MRANLDGHRGFLASEPLMRALAARIGKPAHETIYAAAMAALDGGVDLSDRLRTDGLLAPLRSQPRSTR